MGGSLREVSHLSTLKKCIKLLLHVRRIDEKTDDQSEDLYGSISTMVKECKSKPQDTKIWNFNERVMIGLIETGYLQRELEISGDVSIFPDLLIYFLQSPWSSQELKCVVCRVAVGIDETEYNILKPLIPYYIETFATKNYSIASQAAVSLINLTYKNRENKQTLFNQLPNIIKRLDTIDQKLLSYTLLLLTNLASEASRRKTIASKVKDSLLKIIIGKGVDANFYSSEVISRAFNTLIIISKDHSTLDYFAQNESLRNECVKYIDYPGEILPKLTWLLEIMAEKSNSVKVKIGKLYIPIIIKKLFEGIEIEQIRAIISLINVLVGNKENLDLAKESKILQAFKVLKSDNSVLNDQSLDKNIKLLYSKIVNSDVKNDS